MSILTVLAQNHVVISWSSVMVLLLIRPLFLGVLVILDLQVVTLQLHVICI